MCDWRDCPVQATIALRFGDGFYQKGRGNGIKQRQTYARYCDDHAQLVDRWFVTCDVRPASEVTACGTQVETDRQHRQPR